MDVCVVRACVVRACVVSACVVRACVFTRIRTNTRVRAGVRVHATVNARGPLHPIVHGPRYELINEWCIT